MILKWQKENFTALVLQNEFFSVEKCMYFPLGFYYFDGSSCLVYIYIYIYMCVYIYIYIYIHILLLVKNILNIHCSLYIYIVLMKKASIYIYILVFVSLSIYIYWIYTCFKILSGVLVLSVSMIQVFLANLVIF